MHAFDALCVRRRSRQVSPQAGSCGKLGQLSCNLGIACGASPLHGLVRRRLFFARKPSVRPVLGLHLFSVLFAIVQE